ncbi:L-lactate MFS transporter [Vibrio campbellii]|uniref:L-lactate MFS transporter n=1 Tax=Vibrio campbellii TaxID=680 RepID=A0ACC7RC87_9VIBR|nr:OFA family MFS transporter [Vibrio campbellii]EDL70885.1 permease [Vibrio campbellii HY01]AUV87982.1 MFS transporter [Vibrio campbellii]KGR36465.1 oxalate/formate antiporter [Vibrio campbellii]OQQ03586.1 MFS transporter [Vibrio campbellii]HDM8208126.1 OFA family MFS transporter [Vibrio campbellii]
MINKPFKILLIGLIVNLSIGILYVWGVFSEPLAEALGVDAKHVDGPYQTSVFTFSVSLFLAGVWQDKVGPRIVTILGVFLVGAGLLASGYASTLMELQVTFGCMVGAGMGFAYACIGPCTMKWWPENRKGLVSGLTAGGFAMAALYLAPLSTILIEHFGILDTFKILGIGLLFMIPMASLLVDPPKGYVADEPKGETAESCVDVNIQWLDMLKTPQFYQIWLMFMVSSAAGIMLIGSIGNVSKSIGLTSEEIALSIILLAIFNTAGRVIGGVVFDKIGRVHTLGLIFLLQAVNMIFFTTIETTIPLMIGISVGAMSYGALFGVFPPVTAIDYGLKSYGTNFGILYSAWGVSGFFGGILASISGTTETTYLAFAVLLFFITAMNYLMKPVDKSEIVNRNAAKLEY